MMDELQIGAGTPAIFGETEAGEAAKARKKVKELVKGMSTSTFDLMEALHEVKTKKFYLPKYDTFSDFAKTLDLKVTKAYYLVRIKDVMTEANIDRTVYEPIGIAKLRVIASIEPYDENGAPGAKAIQQIKNLVEHAPTATLEDLKSLVDAYEGNVGDDAWSWLNIKIKKGALKVVRQALDLTKLQIGSVAKDSDGNSVDASDGRCLEMICMDFVSDPNQQPDMEAVYGEDIHNPELSS